MTRFVRIDKLPKVCDGETVNGMLGETYPNWTREMCDWYNENQDKVKAIHRNKNLEYNCWQFALEFINEEEATVFALQFG